MAGAQLAVVAFAQFDASNFGNGVGFVGWPQRAGEQSTFGHGLRSMARVNAAGAEKQQFFYAALKRRVNHVGLHHQILVTEFGWVGVVGINAIYLCCGQENLIGLFSLKKSLHGGLIGQVEVGMGTSDDICGGLASAQQLSEDGGADHAAVACDVYLDWGICHVFRPYSAA